jgi:hypothetical protein
VPRGGLPLSNKKADVIPAKAGTHSIGGIHPLNASENTGEDRDQGAGQISTMTEWVRTFDGMAVFLNGNDRQTAIRIPVERRGLFQKPRRLGDSGVFSKSRHRDPLAVTIQRLGPGPRRSTGMRIDF